MKKSLKQFFLGGVSLSAVNIGGKIVNLLILPVLTLYLSPADFGIIAIYMLIISFLGMLYNPGIVSVTLRLYYDNNDNSIINKELVGSSLVFLFVFPLIILFISVVLNDLVFDFFFKDFNFWPFGLLAILGSFTPQVVRLWSILFIAKHKTRRVVLLTIVRIILAVSFSLLFIIFYELNSLGRILGLLVGNFFIFFFAFYDLIKYSGFRFSFQSIKTTLILGFPLIFSVFSYVIMESSDKYMIEILLDISQLGIYDLAYVYSSIPLFVIIGFGQVWQPLLFENLKNNNIVELRKISIYYLSILTLFISLSLIFANEIFYFFIDDKFYDAISVIPLIIFGIYFLGLSNIYSSIYNYNKKFKLLGLIASISAILNITLNYFMIIDYGIMGAAFSTLITYFVYFILIINSIEKNNFKIFDLRKTIFSIIFILLNMSIILSFSSKINFSLEVLILKLALVFFLVIFILFFIIEKHYRDKIIIYLKNIF